MKELLHDESLRKSGSIVEVQHKERGNYFTVGSPIKFSDLKPEITGFAAAGRAHRRGAGRAGLQRRTRSRTCSASARPSESRETGAALPCNRTYRLKQLVEGAGDAIIVCDAEGAIVLWNPAAERIFGFTEAEALGRSLDLIIPERQRERHWDGYHTTMATGITKYGADLLRVPALHKDGHTLSIAFTVSMLFSDGSARSRASSPIVRDETARFAEDAQAARRGWRKLEAADQRRRVDETDEQGPRRRPHPGLHPCAVRPHLHPAAGLVRRRRDQGRARRRRRRDARPAARHPRRGQPLLHDAEPQQALDHAGHQEAQGQAGARHADQDLRRAGRELRARRARPHGHHLEPHPGPQPAHDRGLGQGLRARASTPTARSTRTSPSAPAARPRPPASRTARRW